ncbi:MAG: histone-like nucleoid-structuring protein Lsr2, partial [Mycobacterium sp.]
SCPSATRGVGPRAVPLGSDRLSNEARKTVIREWARHNGHPVSDRGRIPRAFTDTFNAA